MIKKLNLLRTLMMLSFLTIFALSCKKDGSNDENLTEAQRIANAKEWYQKVTTKMELKSSSKVENVTQEISWADAELYKQADGSEIIAVPVDIKLNSGAKANGSYLLMISKTGETYKHIIAYHAEKNRFTKEINDKEVKDLYNNTIKANDNRKNSSGTNMSNGKVMVIEDDCTAFYLLEIWYNEYGEIIEIYQHYLYTICEGMIDGGGEEEEEEPTIEWGTVEIQDLSLIFNESGDGDESELDEDGFEVFYNKKTFAQRTSFYNIGGAHFESTQSGNVRKYYSGGEGHTGKYRFGSLTFNGASAVGGTGDPNITIEPVVTSANVYATVAFNSEMRIEIWFQDKRTFIRQNGSSYVRTSGIMQAPITFIAKRIYNNN